jgi:hypothetical protein
LHCTIRPLFQGKHTYDCMIALASLKKNSYKQGKTLVFSIYFRD